MAVKWLQHEDDHSTSPSVRVKNAWSYTSAPPYAFLAMCLIKHGDKFNFTFSLYLTGTCCLQTIQMMALASSYETSKKFYQTIRGRIEEDSNIQLPSSETQIQFPTLPIEMGIELFRPIFFD